MEALLPFGTGAWIFIGVYLLSLIGIGILGKRARKEDSLSDFYLAGSGFGFAILFLTLFATQYSGNTFFAFTGATYRIGYVWIVSLHFMTAVIVCYLIYAPRLYVLAKRKGYVTPSDYVDDRFQKKVLTVIVTLTLIIVLCNFLLAQLMAMGRAMQGLGTDRSRYRVYRRRHRARSHNGHLRHAWRITRCCMDRRDPGCDPRTRIRCVIGIAIRTLRPAC